eukprot:Pgem_evm1s16904
MLETIVLENIRNHSNSYVFPPEFYQNITNYRRLELPAGTNLTVRENVCHDNNCRQRYECTSNNCTSSCTKCKAVNYVHTEQYGEISLIQTLVPSTQKNKQELKQQNSTTPTPSKTKDCICVKRKLCNTCHKIKCCTRCEISKRNLYNHINDIYNMEARRDSVVERLYKFRDVKDNPPQSLFAWGRMTITLKDEVGNTSELWKPKRAEVIAMIAYLFLNQKTYFQNYHPYFFMFENPTGEEVREVQLCETKKYPSYRSGSELSRQFITENEHFDAESEFCRAQLIIDDHWGVHDRSLCPVLRNPVDVKREGWANMEDLSAKKGKGKGKGKSKSKKTKVKSDSDDDSKSKGKKKGVKEKTVTRSQSLEQPPVYDEYKQPEYHSPKQPQPNYQQLEQHEKHEQQYEQHEQYEQQQEQHLYQQHDHYHNQQHVPPQYQQEESQQYEPQNSQQYHQQQQYQQPQHQHHNYQQHPQQYQQD